MSRDWTGQRVGRLTALSSTEKRQFGSVVWRCACDCGQIVERDAGLLNDSMRTGRESSCGCTAGQRLVVDLSGQRYGRLTVLGRTGRGRQGARWRCRCDCGHEVVARSKDLRLGTTTSCGCVQRGHRKARREVLPGDRFGNLIVQYDTGARQAGGKIMLCECDCGRETRVRRALLTTGQTRSCGCLRRGRNAQIAHSGVIETLIDVGRVLA